MALTIPIHELRLSLHTDASFQNTVKRGTQAGYIVGVTTSGLEKGDLASWSPLTWRSYRLRRVVGSILAGETQALIDGFGHAKWIACHLAEAIFSDFRLTARSKVLHKF